VEVVIVPDATAVARLAADAVAAALRSRPAPVIGLATGASPLPTYDVLIERCRAGEISFAGAGMVTLDEYVGLPAGHAQSYRAVIHRELVDHVDVDPAAVHTPDVHAEDLSAACTEYDRLVTRLGVDVQLLGIGSDGHLAFNEPGSALDSRTRVKTLTDRTRRDNARFFADAGDVPRHVVTQGLGTIRQARHLVLVATGAARAGPIAAALEGPVTTMCPASVLQFHPHVSVLVDDAAAARLRLADHHRETFRHKPPWQGL
jgi:glucosamine-6-phosphate deaminase